MNKFASLIVTNSEIHLLLKLSIKPMVSFVSPQNNGLGHTRDCSVENSSTPTNDSDEHAMLYQLGHAQKMEQGDKHTLVRTANKQKTEFELVHESNDHQGILNHVRPRNKVRRSASTSIHSRCLEDNKSERTAIGENTINAHATESREGNLL